MKDMDPRLAEEISQALERLVAASHDAAVRALARAFGTAHGLRKHGSKTGRKSRKQPPMERRSPEAMSGVVQRLHQVIGAEPGQTASSLAAQLDMEVRELKTPLRRLKNQKMIRSTGERQFTRYFPADAAPSD